MRETDRNDIAYWFPAVREAGAPVPETCILKEPCMTSALLDGREPKGFDDLLRQIGAAARALGLPAFLRTGLTSGKHSWERTAMLASDEPGVVRRHVAELVEHSALADIMGLDCSTWAVRRMIPVRPLFHAFAGRMPIVREFRLRVDADEPAVRHVQPYWPVGAIREPSCAGWEDLLRSASRVTSDEYETLRAIAVGAVEYLSGEWSVDLLQDRAGGWWLTDMAVAAQSFWFNPDRDLEGWRPKCVPQQLAVLAA
ncbi:MAG: hypothetical protein IH945_02185 [Armatimonadetes bacterium]|nr:hypothetical protein [Armatimonadota bacterium]